MISNNDGRNIHRYDTKDNWLKYNPILAKGELVFEDDNGTIKQKVGNGINNYKLLSYIGDKEVGNNCPYNIGDIYITMRKENPNIIWRSTQWEQIEQGRVLLSQGTNYPIGSKGGEATHTLTLSEMPSHKHELACAQHNVTTNPQDGRLPWQFPHGIADQICSRDDKNTYYEWYSDTRRNGDGLPHNNMQPYISVYMYKRIS